MVLGLPGWVLCELLSPCDFCCGLGDGVWCGGLLVANEPVLG